MERLLKIGQVKPVAPNAKKDSRLGLGFEKLDRKVFEPEKAYDLVAGTGVQYIRLQSGWQRTETEKGVYHFEWLDSIVDNLIARGMEPWIDLCYGNELYTPLAKEVFGAVGCAPVHTEEEKIAWRNYVEALVVRYKGKVKWYEIWNEPDGRHCWRPEVSAEEYSDFAVDTANAIHRADPEAKAIAGVLCSINLPYFKVMFDRGVAQTADAVSFHRYNANELEALNDIRALRALINQYNPALEIIQGESGTQSDSRGAGALRGGAWTPLKQAKYLLRHRLLDLASEVTFTSHFSAMDMIEALNGRVGDKASYLDFGYFGVIQAEFNEDGLATGAYKPKLSYQALQNLSALFPSSVQAADLPLRRLALESRRVFDRDDVSSQFISLGFRDKGGEALAYWKAADLMRETYEGTISFQLPGTREQIRLVDLLSGDVYELPETMMEKQRDQVVKLVNLPLTDCPMLLTFGDFGVPMK